MRVRGRDVKIGDVLLAKEEDFLISDSTGKLIDAGAPNNVIWYDYVKPRTLLSRLPAGGWITLKGTSVETLWLIPNLLYTVMR